MQTPLTSTLGIEYPIIQAPIGSATHPQLAAEVSKAGGLGMLALSWKSLDECRALIKATKALTDKPFGVNLVLAWDQTERLAICMDEEVPLVSFFWGDSSDYIAPLQVKGIKVCQTVVTAQGAKTYASLGVDCLIAQGWEAGGHVQGKVASSVLIPALANAVDIPFAAAGGFATGQGLVAALALGAGGIVSGTRFLMSHEAYIADEYATYIAKAKEDDTVYVEDLFCEGWEDAPHRVLQNSTVEAWLKAGKPPIGQRPNEGEVIAHDAKANPIRRYADHNPIKGTEGNLEALALYAGQSAGLIQQRLPAKDIIGTIMQEATETIHKLQR